MLPKWDNFRVYLYYRRKLEKVYIERGHCDSETVNQRYSALIHLLARTGIRINEALSLKWEDLSPDRIHIKAENNKTDKERQIPITTETYKILCGLKKYEYIFGSERGKMANDNWLYLVFSVGFAIALYLILKKVEGTEKKLETIERLLQLIFKKKDL